MKLFDLSVSERLKIMDELMTNVALCEIRLSPNYILSFDFINTFNGKPYKKLLCSNVWKVNFQTGMESAEEFPCFITDVNSIKLEGTKVEEAFKYFSFGYNIPKSKTYYFVSIYGGDTDIEILCAGTEISDY